jgi:hypothetical protein
MELTDHCFSGFSLIFLTYPSSLVTQSIDSSQTTPAYFSQYFCDFLSVYRSPGSWWKPIEGHRTHQNVLERDGRLWNIMEHWRTFRKEVHGRPWNLVEGARRRWKDGRF